MEEGCKPAEEAEHSTNTEQHPVVVWPYWEEVDTRTLEADEWAD